MKLGRKIEFPLYLIWYIVMFQDLLLQYQTMVLVIPLLLLMIVQGFVGYISWNKNQSIGIFKVFKALIENSFRKNIKSIILDNGGEYIRKYSHHYCELEGIRMEHSVPYTPQHNGVVERKNRSLKEMETCLLQAKNLPPSLWVEVVKCASYIHMYWRKLYNK